ncbi:MAG: hypothetical protein ABI999_01605, partial [Acidobacteriota bacterium]
RLYVALVPFVVLAAVHSRWWLLGLPLWLAARTAKRILAHRFEFGVGTLFNPVIFFGVAGLILLIDLATFVGWIQAILFRQADPQPSTTPAAEPAAPPRQGGEF